MSVRDLPALNATLNALSAAMLLLAYALIRRRRITAHRSVMLAAVTTSAAFLASYLIYHYHAGSVPFQGQGLVRTVYFTILISHTILAVVIVPLVLITLTRGLRAHYAAHKRIARWTFPLWLYVSVTGVVIYVMLYRMGFGT